MSDLVIPLPPDLVDALVTRVAEIVLDRLKEQAGPAPASKYLTVPEAAELLRCRRGRIDDLLSQSRLTRVKDGTRTLVLRFFAAQVGVLLAAGIAIGTAAGLVLSNAMSRSVFHLSTDVRPGAVALAAGACAAMAFLASIVPVRRAFGVNPAQVLKGE